VDTELLRTFLEVRRTRHFARAADNLYVTQAAVSARIRLLEEKLGQRLLTRDRNNIQLTAAGHQLVPYAENVLETWNRAVLEISSIQVPLVVIGCLPSLREIYLDDWLGALLRDGADFRLQLESVDTLEIIGRVREHSLDLGMVYEAPRTADVWTEELCRFELALVSTTPGLTMDAGLDGFIQVDWGTSLGTGRDTLPGGTAARARLDSAVLARRLLLTLGGSAYLPGPLIADDLRQGRLHPIIGSPRPERRVLLIGSAAGRDLRAVAALIPTLHRLAQAGRAG
jgi:DNA-binding transcriptional LysR family regulator